VTAPAYLRATLHLARCVPALDGAISAANGNLGLRGMHRKTARHLLQQVKLQLGTRALGDVQYADFLAARPNMVQKGLQMTQSDMLETVLLAGADLVHGHLRPAAGGRESFSSYKGKHNSIPALLPDVNEALLGSSQQQWMRAADLQVGDHVPVINAHMANQTLGADVESEDGVIHAEIHHRPVRMEGDALCAGKLTQAAMGRAAASN
jgi:hypothetical protein